MIVKDSSKPQQSYSSNRKRHEFQGEFATNTSLAGDNI